MKAALPYLALLVASTIMPLAGAPVTYATQLSGPQEAPPNASPGVGYSVLTIDDEAHTLHIVAGFSGLLAPTTASHIHVIADVDPRPATGGVVTQVPSFIGFPLGVMSGNYDSTFDTLDASTYNLSFLNNPVNNGNTATAEATLFAAIADGRAYLNIHSTMFPGGEIRGFFTPVPEPATVGMMGVALAGLVFLRRR